MSDLEIPLGRREPLYRALEMLPAVVSISIPLAVILLSLADPLLGAMAVVVFVAFALLRAVRGGIDAIRGYRRLRAGESVDWAALLRQLEREIVAGGAPRGVDRDAGAPTALPNRFAARHAQLLERISHGSSAYPAPSSLVHAVIVAAYNEPYEVIAPSLHSLAASTIGAERLVVVFAHEERGGDAMRSTAERLEHEFAGRFRAFLRVEHPAGLEGEIPGKGGNITYAGRALAAWVRMQGVDEQSVLVTTLDCDNRVHPAYFDYVSYEFVSAPDRARSSFQPISLFVNNLWHAPAPTRVIAAGNSLWNLISTVRPYSLRNFASHTQPLPALLEMDFWSRRTVVEDGHQYWRSYFHFDGDYTVVAVHVPIYQDAVLAEGLRRTLLAQFRQLARWSYGASDVAYAGTRMFDPGSRAPLGPTLRRFVILLDSHVTLAVIAPMIAFGAWLPLLAAGRLEAPDGSALADLLEGLNPLGWGERAAETASVVSTALEPMIESGRPLPGYSEALLVEQLPQLIGTVQQAALLGVVVTIVITLLLTPPKPAGVPSARRAGMLLQWLLLPITILCYSTASAVISQFRLLIGAYREAFVVTEKAAAPGNAQETQTRQSLSGQQVSRHAAFEDD